MRRPIRNYAPSTGRSSSLIVMGVVLPSASPADSADVELVSQQYALWADQTMHSSVTGFMPSELMTGQSSVMPTEAASVTWSLLPWKEEMSREELLAVRIRQLEG